MADISQWEDKTVKREQWQETDGTAYRRFYNVPSAIVAAGSLPAEGDVMPGSTAALLGPFIEKGGISFGKQRDGDNQQVILKCKLLATP